MEIKRTGSCPSGKEAAEYFTGIVRIDHLFDAAAPARAYIVELLPDVLEGRIDPGRVFDRAVRPDGVPDGYRAMNEREAIKV